MRITPGLGAIPSWLGPLSEPRGARLCSFLSELRALFGHSRPRSMQQASRRIIL